jgi:hypothetical protein
MVFSNNPWYFKTCAWDAGTALKPALWTLFLSNMSLDKKFPSLYQSIIGHPPKGFEFAAEKYFGIVTDLT